MRRGMVLGKPESASEVVKSNTSLTITRTVQDRTDVPDKQLPSNRRELGKVGHWDVPSRGGGEYLVPDPGDRLSNY